MFRLLGVPARYVTGYVVTPEDFTEDGDGYTAQIPDTQAHAWVEVYRAGKGWIPVEVTPGYQDSSDANTDPGRMAKRVRRHRSRLRNRRKRQHRNLRKHHSRSRAGQR